MWNSFHTFKARLAFGLVRRDHSWEMNNLVFVVFDSARFDHTKSAKTKWLKKLGSIEKRFSYASWTPPSHQIFA
jgi:hypothetical protein